MIIGISGKIGSGKDTIGKIIQTLDYLKRTKIEYSFAAFEYNFKKEKLEGGFGFTVWEIKKFAGKLKQIIALLTGCTVEQLEDQNFKDGYLGEEWDFYRKGIHLLPDHPDEAIRKELGLGRVFRMRYRDLLQRVGTEAMRNMIHQNTWVNALFADYKVNPNLLVWTKKIDSLHYMSHNVTLCGRPMLGNNYASNYLSIDSELESDPRKYCDECLSKAFPYWIVTDTRFPNEAEAIKSRNGIMIRVNRKTRTFETGYGSVTVIPMFNGIVEPSTHPSETSLDNYEFDYVINNNGTLEELVEKVKEILTKEKLL